MTSCCLTLTSYVFSDELERRAEHTMRQLMSTCELGDSASTAEILLYEHSKMETEAKVRCCESH